VQIEFRSFPQKLYRAEKVVEDTQGYWEPREEYIDKIGVLRL